MLTKFSLDSYLKSLDVKLPEEKQFQTLVDELAYFKSLGAIKSNPHHTWDKSISNFNFERGYLLYCTVSKYKPKNILEFGIGCGFSTLCMAWALTELKSNGKILTMDYVPHDQKYLQYYKNSGKFFKRNISRAELWQKIAKQSWINKIQIETGYASETVTKITAEPFDFIYIDGGHYENQFKHDFFSSLLLSNSKPFFLCDDYMDKEDFGVKKFVDEEIAKYFKVDLIKTDQSNLMEKNKIATTSGMCTIEGSRDELIEHFGIKHIQKFLNEYRKFEKRLKFRAKLNRKIPFLKNIRFSRVIKKHRNTFNHSKK